MIRTTLPQDQRAFTLVELLVATVVLLIILLMLVAMVNQTSTIWRSTTSKVEQFRSARTAFESVTRQLGQATLNPYYDYARNKKGYSIQYVRQSDLRFIVGSCGDLYAPSSSNKAPVSGPGHAVFFQAPIGFVSDDPETQDTAASTSGSPQYLYSEMDNVLNTWGYFTEYGSDYSYRPAFLNTASGNFVPPTERYRYRLMEFMVPSDRMTLYQKTSAPPTASGGDYDSNGYYIGHEWFDSFLQLPTTSPSTSINATSTTPVRPAHLLAENIIMFVLAPQLSAVDQASLPSGYSLAPSYSYDSTQTNPQLANNPTDKNALATDPKNQLPPVVQVTMVAIDEPSAARLEANTSLKSTMQGLLGVNGGTARWFSASSTKTGAAGDAQTGTSASNYNSDLTSTTQSNGTPGLQPYLTNNHIAYRTFTTTISLRAAKWSRD